MHWLSAILAVIAYRALPTFEQTLSASEGEWAFLPSDTAPEVVVLLSAWLAYRRRDRLLALSPGAGPPWLWGPLLGLGAAIFVWATATEAADLLAPSLGLVGLGCACLARGAAAVRVMLLPAAFLLFAVPIPAPLLNEIVFWLQIGSAEYAGWILFLLGVPALVEGEVVLQPDAAFKVIETCSGFRSVVTLMMLSIVLSDLFRRPPGRALVLLAVAPLVGFFLNGFRVAALILNPHSAIAEVHDLQGVVILLAGLAILYGFDGLLERLPGPRHRTGPAPAARAGGPTGALARFLPPALLLALVAVSLWLPPLEPWRTPMRIAVFAPFEEELQGWVTSRRDVDIVFLGSTGFFHHTSLRFTRVGAEAESVDLFLAIGDHPERRERSILSPKLGLPAGGWTIQEERDTRIGVVGPRVRERVVRSGGQLRLVYHWYVGSTGTLRESLRTLLALDHGPFRRELDPLALRMSTTLRGTSPEDRSDAADRLVGLYRAVATRLERLERSLSTEPPS